MSGYRFTSDRYVSSLRTGDKGERISLVMFCIFCKANDGHCKRFITHFQTANIKCLGGFLFSSPTAILLFFRIEDEVSITQSLNMNGVKVFSNPGDVNTTRNLQERMRVISHINQLIPLSRLVRV